jgi:hypothetical protein
MELYESSLDDLKIVREYGLAWTRHGDVEVSMKVTGMLKQ